MRAERRGHVARGLDRETALLRERKEGLGRFFRDEGQVDGLLDKGSLVGAAEHEQRFGKADRARVHGVQAIDELAVVAARIAARHIEQRLRDRERRAQLMRRVRGEPLLLGDVRFESREHRVERVRELAELIVPALQSDAVRERSLRSHARRLGDARQRREHVAREEPAAEQAEHEQERHDDGCDRRKVAQQIGMAAHEEEHTRMHATGQREVPGDEQDGAGEHQEAGVAERQPQANAQARRPMPSMR